MAVDRLSVTVPARLGRALRALAKARGANVSTVVTEAIEREVRLAALDRALHDADERFGPVSDDLVRRAQVRRLRSTSGAVMSSPLWYSALLCLACGSSAAATPPADAAGDSGDASDAPADATDATTDSDVDDVVVPGCAVCQPASYTCKSSVPNQESATLLISSVSGASCSADLQGTKLEFFCNPAEVCREGSCSAYSYDGQELTFAHYGNPVICYPAK